MGQDATAKTYTVPKAVLCAGSKWFDSALKDGRFLEGNSHKIRLPDDPPEALELLLYYAYHRRLMWPDRPSTAEECGHELETCMTLWTMGDKYLMHDLQNNAMHRICALLCGADLPDHGYQLTPAILAQCYKACTDASPLRCLILDYMVDKMATDPSAFVSAETFAALPGVLQLVHASSEARHQGNFPRYKKPRAHSELLCVKLNEN